MSDSDPVSFTKRDAERIAKQTRRGEADALYGNPRSQRRSLPPLRSPHTLYARITSTTTTADQNGHAWYPAVWVLQDVAGGAWTDGNPIWIQGANYETLVLGTRYQIREAGSFSGPPVLAAFTAIGAGGSGGGSGYDDFFLGTLTTDRVNPGQIVQLSWATSGIGRTPSNLGYTQTSGLVFYGGNGITIPKYAGPIGDYDVGVRGLDAWVCLSCTAIGNISLAIGNSIGSNPLACVNANSIYIDIASVGKPRLLSAAGMFTETANSNLAYTYSVLLTNNTLGTVTFAAGAAFPPFDLSIPAGAFKIRNLSDL